MNETNIPLLRKIALSIVVLGIGCSIFLMIHGRNTPLFLLVLFIIWVLAPFNALLVVDFISRNWLTGSRRTLYILMIVITAVSLVCYTGILNPPGTKPAFMFLVVPFVSLLLITLVVVKLKRKNKN